MATFLKKLDRRIFCIALGVILFLASFTFASAIETSGGRVRVERLNLMTEEGYKLSAKIYIPDNATAETPAPAILAAPGGNASLENLTCVSVELSRRGYVVLAFDPYTIGRSDAVNTADVGSISAMKYLMSLDIVDKEHIGGVGHSAGSGRVAKAVSLEDGSIREGVKAVMYLGAGSFNLEGVNMGVFLGSFDNTYGQGKTSIRDLFTAETFTSKLGVDTVVEGQWYGDPEQGTGKILYSGFSGHTSALFLPAPIQAIVDFFDTALMKAPVAQNGLVYGWKALGTTLGLVGALMVMFQVISLCVDTKFFATIKRERTEAVSGINAPFLFYFITPAIINALVCAWAIYNGQMLLAKIPILRINNVNGFVFWFGFSTLLSLGILILRFLWDKKIDRNRVIQHAKISLPNYGKALLLGLIALVTLYAFTYVSETLWCLSPRAWKLQINLLTPERMKLFLTYFPLYLVFFSVFNYNHTIGLRLKGQSEGGFTALVWLSSAFPVILFLGFTYGKLIFTGYTAITNVQMSRANSSLLCNFLTYFVVCKVTTFFYKKTGSFHTGAIINAAIMTWVAIGTDLVTALVP